MIYVYAYVCRYIVISSITIIKVLQPYNVKEKRHMFLHAYR